MSTDTIQYALTAVIAPLAILTVLLAFPMGYRGRWLTGSLLLGWLALTALTTIRGIGPVPGGLFGIILPVIVVGGFMLGNTAARSAVLKASVPALVALHVTRVAGGMFIPLHWDGRLANPFAYVAGTGDLLSAAFAIPAAFIAWRAAAGWEQKVLAWNVFGFADFLIAVFLGVTSQPGLPFRLFFDDPGTQVLGTLPWRYIPSYFVPLYLMIHIALFIRLVSAIWFERRPVPA
jgi:hypothetical protein